MNMSSIAPSRMQLDQLKWESLKEYNIGVDLGFLHNRLRFTFDYYWRDREDILNKTSEYLLQQDFPILHTSTRGYQKPGMGIPYRPGIL